MAKVEYELDGHVAVVTMNDGENRFNFPFFEAFTTVLDTIEHDTSATILVVRSAHEKIWCNGIDLDWFIPAVDKEGPALRARFLAAMFGFMKRVLTYPMLTVAAITGHAFAGGALLAFTHDFRFMRAERGWLCLPEVDLGMPLGPFFTALSRRAVPTYKFEEMLYTGKRLTAQECVEHHIVMKACHMDDLMRETLAFAKALHKPREIIKKLKADTNKELLEILDASIASLSR